MPGQATDVGLLYGEFAEIVAGEGGAQGRGKLRAPCGLGNHNRELAANYGLQGRASRGRGLPDDHGHRERVAIGVRRAFARHGHGVAVEWSVGTGWRS